MNREETHAFVLGVASTIREEDYAFTVEAGGTEWDVYRFCVNGRDGMVAWRNHDGQVEIGFFRAGSFTEKDVVSGITSGLPS